jgi:hypothetical protein
MHLGADQVGESRQTLPQPIKWQGVRGIAFEAKSIGEYARNCSGGAGGMATFA